ncbi:MULTISPECIES: peptidoglycan meso-diaminopimelic acid protein amidase [unclassified Tatumella]|uniref:peptidoglycan meso-diaminopimelic acid protein amidase n=1 Tax=unclassified Tatumella TaxID=2649542 RepID=UPI001BAE84CD|nr:MULTISPECIES: peptidoglycan meso-diaminopimelic acid protein amidase [unclassified Tatumella]MBS0857010.1 murein L,D-transpeptidase [Tatumella sp. JGM16]MBS0878340.1 murein L,D-transpeptidase [Tatumella sp. JGM82]MBS0891829.1 murein L,D-transpeptidase [Tatumella sp. JGM94]MBS0894616.1 murein L,D-transpeptidase [Tatumella sp. JGM130]MBS0903038.1 murein L,D-transpeptidase [Tatumella sp. JGM100]
MRKIALLLAMFLIPACCLAISENPVTPQLPVSKQLKQQLLGTQVFIQIFKEERTLDLYGKIGNEYRLLDSFRICDFSGGLGPKRTEGDFKSPEGFYSVHFNQLKPDSHFYRAINLGFPNQFDRENGYSGNYLMIHGNCVSIGCYAMTNAYMDQIYTYVNAALRNGQSEVEVNIFPFRMTENNMQRHRDSAYISFWKQLKPGYDYFLKYKRPPTMTVSNGQYVLSQTPFSAPPEAASKHFLALTQTK